MSATEPTDDAHELPDDPRDWLGLRFKNTGSKAYRVAGYRVVNGSEEIQTYDEHTGGKSAWVDVRVAREKLAGDYYTIL